MGKISATFVAASCLSAIAISYFDQKLQGYRVVDAPSSAYFFTPIRLFNAALYKQEGARYRRQALGAMVFAAAFFALACLAISVGL